MMPAAMPPELMAVAGAAPSFAAPAPSTAARGGSAPIVEDDVD